MRKWDMAEFEFAGYSSGNPFTDYEIYGEFYNENESKKTAGFYDGDGIYRVRFMPSYEGKYRYRVWGSFSDKEYTGEFFVDKAESRGMVRANGRHFIYDDGTPYYSIGTTCYAWANQSRELQAQTIETLRTGAFNKIRFCVFPKHYDYNYRDPVCFPYKGTPIDNSDINKFNFNDYNENSEGNDWDFSVFNVEYFQMLDRGIENLMRLGIEADIILFHPYDRWGFSNMPSWANDLYLKYVTARFGAYRNVWWSLANEYDLCNNKTHDDWEHYAKIVTENDSYHHLISIHNCVPLYDFTKPWVTHCSIQRQVGKNELDNIYEWLDKYNKPIVIDEMCYEGNIEQSWGNISGEEMTRRMWKTVVLGAYPGHSECYMNNNIWWSHGGRLYGESHKRLHFLHKIMTECTALHPTGYTTAANENGSVNLQYFGEHRPCYRVFDFGNKKYKIKVIDTWNMTTEDKGVYTGKVKIDLPSREYMALLWAEVTD